MLPDESLEGAGAREGLLSSIFPARVPGITKAPHDVRDRGENGPYHGGGDRTGGSAGETGVCTTHTCERRPPKDRGANHPSGPFAGIPDPRGHGVWPGRDDENPFGDRATCV